MDRRTCTSIPLHLSVVSILLLLGVTSAPAPEAQNYFWHVTDFHMDVNFTTSGNAYKMCWQTNSKAKASASPMGSFGDYRCDSPYKLVKSAVNAMQKIGPNPDFILWTGDDKAHVSDANFSPDIVFQIVKNLTETLKGVFPNVPVVPVLGNHDWYPTHLLPAGNASLYRKIGTLWKPWIKDSGYETFQRGGFYTLKLEKGPRFVVLNTALYYKKNKATQLSANDTDPGGQFAWFDQTMTEAKNNNEKVYVTSHVPPGIFERHIMKGGFRWLHPIANKKLVELVVKHSSSIIGLFFAHHHTDSFRIFYNEKGLPVSWMLVAPAVTPWNTTLSQVGPNNPALRKVVYDAQNQEIKTFVQYFLNLSKANEDGQADWEVEYDAQTAYNFGNDGITPGTLDRLAQSFNTANRSLFDQYYLHNSVSYQPASECDDTCRKYHYCVITNVDYDSFDRCKWSSPDNSGALGNTRADVGMVLLVMVLVHVGGLLGMSIT